VTKRVSPIDSIRVDIDQLFAADQHLSRHPSRAPCQRLLHPARHPRRRSCSPGPGRSGATLSTSATPTRRRLENLRTRARRCHPHSPARGLT
jgi:hypothetical protein